MPNAAGFDAEEQLHNANVAITDLEREALAHHEEITARAERTARELTFALGIKRMSEALVEGSQTLAFHCATNGLLFGLGLNHRRLVNQHVTELFDEMLVALGLRASKEFDIFLW